MDSTLLVRTEAAENRLRQLGFVVSRVRCHGDIACIECRGEDIARLSDLAVRTQVAPRFKIVGCKFITLDLEGYRQGSMNPPEAETHP